MWKWWDCAGQMWDVYFSELWMVALRETGIWNVRYRNSHFLLLSLQNPTEISI